MAKLAPIGMESPRCFHAIKISSKLNLVLHDEQILTVEVIKKEEDMQSDALIAKGDDGFYMLMFMKGKGEVNETSNYELFIAITNDSGNFSRDPIWSINVVKIAVACK